MPYGENVDATMTKGIKRGGPRQGEGSEGVRGPVQSPAHGLPAQGPPGSGEALEAMFHLCLQRHPAVPAGAGAVANGS